MAGHQRFRHGGQSKPPNRRASEINLKDLVTSLAQQVADLSKKVDQVELLSIGIALNLGIDGAQALASLKQMEILDRISKR